MTNKNTTLMHAININTRERRFPEYVKPRALEYDLSQSGPADGARHQRANSTRHTTM